MPLTLPLTNVITITKPKSGQLKIISVTDPYGSQSVDANDDGFTVTGEVTLPNFLTDGDFDSTVSLLAHGVTLPGMAFTGKIGETKINVVGKPGEPQNATVYPFTLDYDKSKNVADGAFELIITFVYGDASWDIQSFVSLGDWQFV